ncbi:MAG: DUF937 domain-containing protein [Hyphomicrobium sp.]
MQIESIIKGAQGGKAVRNLATSFGVDADRTEPVVHTVVKALAERIERNTLSRAGIADIVTVMGEPHAGRALVDAQRLATPELAAVGNHILDVLIGSKHISRGIAAKAARDSGLNEETVKKMLPVIASMVVGSLQQGAAPVLSSKLAELPALARSPLPLPGDRLPPASPPSNDWSIDLPQPSGSGGGGIGGTVGHSRPLPLPGDDIPGLGRGRTTQLPELPDIIRRGGTRVPGPTGGSLEEIIRSILGNLLGFKNTGVLGWIAKIVLSRWFLGFVQRILSRVLLGR